MKGFTLNEERDPVKRLRNLKRSRVQIWERVIILLDQADIITHEINTMNNEEQHAGEPEKSL